MTAAQELRSGHDEPAPTSSRPAEPAEPGHRREWTAVTWSVVAVGALVVRAVDDAFLHPAAGLGATDHLLSGTVPVAVGVAAGAAILRSRGALRTFAALVAGLWGLVGSMELFIETGPAHRGLQADDVSSVLSLVAGVALLVAFGYFASVSVSRGRSRAARAGRRGAKAIGLTAAAIVVVFPLGLGYMATHFAGPGLTTAPDLDAPVEHVRFASSDGLELTGWYSPTQNGAVVVVLPGRSGVDQARMLVRHGYGVLLVNRRGEADSEGDANLYGWGGTQDVAGAVRYLRDERGIAPGAIGGLGLSVGGEVMLEHALRSDDLAGVVAEGIGSRSVKESLELSGAIRVAELTTHPLLTVGLVVLADRPAPPNLVDLTEDLEPGRAFIIWGERGQPAEKLLGPTYVEAAGGAAVWWEAPGARHTRAIDAVPDEYERRVVAYFDTALLHRP